MHDEFDDNENKVDVQSINFAYPSAKKSLKGRVDRFAGKILSFLLFFVKVGLA